MLLLVCWTCYLSEGKTSEGLSSHLCIHLVLLFTQQLLSKRFWLICGGCDNDNDCILVNHNVVVCKNWNKVWYKTWPKLWIIVSDKYCLLKWKGWSLVIWKTVSNLYCENGLWPFFTTENNVPRLCIMDFRTISTMHNFVQMALYIKNKECS